MDIAGILVRRSKIILLLYTVVVFIVAINAKNLYMEFDLAVFLPENEPSITLLNYVTEKWNMGSSMIVYVESDDVLSLKTLEDIEYVVNKIDIYRYDKGELDGVVSENSITTMLKLENSLPPPLGEGKFQLPTDENKIKKYVARMGDARKALITDDYKSSAVIFTLSPDVDPEVIMSRAESAISNVTTKMTLVGSLPLSQSMRERSLRNLTLIFPLSILFVSIVLFAFHRSLKGLLVTFLPTSYSILLTFGILGMVRPQLTMLSLAIVALMMGLGVDYSIHLMNRFLEERGSFEEKARRSLKTTGKAILLSALTTAIGFGSLMISTMPPIVDFGFGCALGIVLCYVSTMVMVVPLVVILNFKKRIEFPAWKKLAVFSVRNSKKTLILGIIIVVLSLSVFPKVQTDVNYLAMAPKDDPVVTKTLEFSEKFGLSGNLNVILVRGDLESPDVIEAIYNMEENIRYDPVVYKNNVTVTSIADVIKKINLGSLPKDRAKLQLIYTFLSDQIELLVDENLTETIISVNIPAGLSIEEQRDVVNAIDSIISNTTIPGGKVYPLTGATPISVSINDILMDQQVRSMLVSLLLVFATLIIIFGSSGYAFVTMLPVIFVLLSEPCVLVLLDVPLTMVTISIASIIVGTGVDYGVHITKRFLEGIEEGLMDVEAMERAIEETGLSLLEAALTTIAGLISVYFINVPYLEEFMRLIIAMITLSLLGAVFLMPALLRVRHE
ncbi:MAG: RND family transporter [Thermoplasmata archaeon]|nr:MAG: RND family transporter [Thermoplasmata archaeon]